MTTFAWILLVVGLYMVVNPIFSDPDAEPWSDRSYEDFQKTQTIAMIIGVVVMIIGLMILIFC